MIPAMYAYRMTVWARLNDQGFTPEEISHLLFLGWLWARRPEAAR